MFVTEAIFSAIFNILSIYIAFRMVKLFISPKEEMQQYSKIVYFLIWSINWCLYYSFNNVVVTIASLATGMLIATFLLYDGTIVRKMISVISAMALGMVSENIIWILFGHLSGLRDNAALGSLFSSCFNMVLILILERFFEVKKTKYISKSSYFNIAVIIFGSIILGEIIVELSGDNQKLAMVGLSAICLIDVSTYYIYDKINEMYLQKLERKSFKQRMEMYENQLELIEQSQKKIRSLRHDMKKHMLLIQSYIDNQDYSKALQYIKEVDDYVTVSGQYICTGNREIDAILNYMLARAERNGCTIEKDIQVPDNVFMEKMDLNILLGNLLDNALEALEKVTEPYLYINMKYKKGIFTLKIKNSYNGVIVKQGEHYISGKRDREYHGIGLQNVNEIVKKYDGHIKIETTEDMFKVAIMLYVEAVQD